MNITRPGCPFCQSRNTEWKIKAHQWECTDCEKRFSDEATHPAAIETSSPCISAESTLPNLPTYLAIPWVEYGSEAHTRVKLLWMCDVVELMVRFTISVLLAEIRILKPDNPLPDDLQRQFERPTFGVWLNLLVTLDKLKPLQPKVAGSLFRWLNKPLEQYPGNLHQLITVGTDGNRNFLELRNHLAHGGGISLTAANEQLNRHQDLFKQLLESLNKAMVELEVITVLENQAWLLKGDKPQPIALPQGLLTQDANKTWLVGKDKNAIELTPLLRFEPICHPRTQITGETAPQCYIRGTVARQDFTPLGVDAMCSSINDPSFANLFKKQEVKPSSKRSAATAETFLEEAQQFAQGMVGRKKALEILKTWRKGINPWEPSTSRMGLFTGKPGTGKSMLMAKLADDLSKGKNPLYYYRFKGGDSRNNRSDFIHGLIAKLSSWPVLNVKIDNEDDPEKKLLTLLQGMTRIPQPENPSENRPFLTVILDGLDEITAHDAKFPDLIKILAEPKGSIWIMSSRPGLNAHFAGELFSIPGLKELHGLNKDEIRGMLIQGLSGGKAMGLLRLDKDESQDAPPRNPYIDEIVEKADGLPLYVHYVIEDLLSNKKTFTTGSLPKGLTEYYQEMLNTQGINDIMSDLPRLIAALACSAEPLDITSLTLLLGDDPSDFEHDKSYVLSVIALGSTMLKESLTPEGTLGYTLYHTSLRDHVNQSVVLNRTVKKIRKSLYQKAEQWHSLQKGTLRNHLLRQGNRYLVDWHPEGIRVVCDRLTHFSWLMARLEQTLTRRLDELINDYLHIDSYISSKGMHKGDLGIWLDFMRSKKHILNRAKDYWPADRLLLQMAVEHADDSPITHQAEAWIAAGHCTWTWLRDTHRPAYLQKDPCIAVLEGHHDHINGARILSSGNILSWSFDKTLRVWDSKTGVQLLLMQGHTDRVYGAIALNNERILSISGDNTRRVWDAETGFQLVLLQNHESEIYLDNGLILSREADNTFRVWDAEVDKQVAFMQGHTDRINGAIALNNDRIISWALDNSLRVWDIKTGKQLALMQGHSDFVHSVIVLDNNRILSYSYDKTLRVWDTETGVQLTLMQGHIDSIAGAKVLDKWRIISWSSDNTLRIWDVNNGMQLVLVHTETKRIFNVIALNNGHIISWGEDNILRLWDTNTGKLLAIMQGHTDMVHGALALENGCIISWSVDRTLRVWDAITGAQLSLMLGHVGAIGHAMVLNNGLILTVSADRTMRLWDAEIGLQVTPIQMDADRVYKAEVFDEGRIASWSTDRTLRVWDDESGVQLFSKENIDIFLQGRFIDERRILSWSNDKILRVLDIETGEQLALMQGHIDNVVGALVLSNELILSWSYDCSLRVWDAENGAQLTVMLGHTASIKESIVLNDGRILSLSEDKTLRVWSVENGVQLAVMEGHTEIIKGFIVFDIIRILTWSYDGTLRVWDSVTGRQLALMQGHSSTVVGAIVLDNGRILSWSHDGTLRVWDTKSGNQLALMQGHSHYVDGSIDLNNGHILSWSRDASVRIWDAENGAQTGLMQSHTYDVTGAEVLDNGCIVSWSERESIYFKPCFNICASSGTSQFEATQIIEIFNLSTNLLHVYVDKSLKYEYINTNPYLLLLGEPSNLPDGTTLCWADDAPMAEVIHMAPNKLITVKTSSGRLRFLQWQNLTAVGWQNKSNTLIK